jgi:two-component system, OmpR family, response regulator ChvI
MPNITRGIWDLSEKMVPQKFHDDIVFQGISYNFCVCMLDVVNSTAITASLASEDKIRKFYSVFVNSVSPVISHFGGRVLKTGGDSIIYYFPNTSEVEYIDGLRDVLECGLSLLELRSTVNFIYESEGICRLGIG